jgi:hypothetical protein
MEFSAVAVERAMTYQQVILRTLAGTWTSSCAKIRPKATRPRDSRT